MVVYVHCLPLSLCLSRSMCCILNNIIPSGCARMHDSVRETKIVVLSFTFCVCLYVTMFPFLFLNLYTDVNHCITVYIHVQLFSCSMGVSVSGGKDTLTRMLWTFSSMSSTSASPRTAYFEAE